MTIGIYALCLDGEVKYIGQSRDIKKRYRQHCSLAQNVGKTKKDEWLYEILLKDINPELLILEETEDLDKKEIEWIKKYRDEGILLNLSDGGQTMSYLRKKKLEKPWGKTHSPIQRRLSVIKRNIEYFNRMGMTKMANSASEKYNSVVDFIKSQDREKLNLLLWNKYGR